VNNRKIISSDLTRKKVQEALKNKNPINKNSLTAHQIHSERQNIKSANRNVVKSKIERPRVNQGNKRPSSQYLAKIKSKTLKLNLPQSGSFNGSILNIGEKFLCVYRPNESEIIACFLNYDYSIIPKLYYKFNLLLVSDPRIIITPDNKVLMSYSKYYTNNDSNEYIDGNIIMDLNESKNKIFQGETIRISPEHLKDRQKNWMPFVHEDKLYFIANVCPHQIYEVDWTGQKKSNLIYETFWENPWFVKENLRGNTNAVMLPDGNYLGTFHTVTRKNILHYYDNGFYIFEGKPPFTVTHISKQTYLRAEDAIEPYFRKAGIILCTFPVGMVLEKDKIIISYGDNDSCVKILELSLNDVMDIMVNVKEK
jgi:predicted GH43/DUF377 family glycosyl hydrolase